jgi:hypothetical protein
MSLPIAKKAITIGHLCFKFTCTPGPEEEEYLDTEVYVGDNYFCSISWADVEEFIKEIRIVVGRYAI